MWTVLRRVEKGVKVALIAACLLAVWAGVVRLVGGAGAYRRLGVTYPQVALTYLLGGAAAGAVAGLLAPLARYRLGGVLVGLVAAVPFAAASAYVEYGPPPWRDSGVQSTFVVAALIAALVGWALPPRLREIDARAAAARGEPPPS